MKSIAVDMFAVKRPGRETGASWKGRLSRVWVMLDGNF